MSNGSQQSMADRFAEAVKTPGDMAEAMKDAAMQGDEGSMFEMVQEQPFKLAEVRPAPNTDPVKVLVPAPAPRPPNTVSVEYVGPSDAMSFIATNPIEMVEYASDSFPDLVLAPANAADDIMTGD